jgi:hypothetical protein
MEAKIAAVQQKLTNRINALSDSIDELTKHLHWSVRYEMIQERFKNGDKIDGYSWTRERTIIPKPCCASDKTIYPGAIAYKGIAEAFSGGQTIWLSKEEFIMRKLKGQI